MEEQVEGNRGSGSPSRHQFTIQVQDQDEPWSGWKLERDPGLIPGEVVSRQQSQQKPMSQQCNRDDQVRRQPETVVAPARCFLSQAALEEAGGSPALPSLGMVTRLNQRSEEKSLTHREPQWAEHHGMLPNSNLLSVYSTPHIFQRQHGKWNSSKLENFLWKLAYWILSCTSHVLLTKRFRGVTKPISMRTEREGDALTAATSYKSQG